MRRPILIVSLIVGGALFAPFLAPADPMQTNPAEQLQPPSADHWMGTDHLGRDVLSRALYGGQRTLVITTLATAIGVVPGALLGIVAGAAGGWVDKVIGLFINALLAFPNLVLALVVLTLLGAGPEQVAIATGVAYIAAYGRVARSAVMTVRPMAYIEAAKALGATPMHIARYHIFPNILPVLLAYVGVVFGYSLLSSAALSFLGLGGEPGAPDWGVMLAEGRLAFRSAPWIGLAPGVAITATVIAVNSLADKLAAVERR